MIKKKIFIGTVIGFKNEARIVSDNVESIIFIEDAFLRRVQSKKMYAFAETRYTRDKESNIVMHVKPLFEISKDTYEVMKLVNRRINLIAIMRLINAISSGKLKLERPLENLEEIKAGIFKMQLDNADADTILSSESYNTIIDAIIVHLQHCNDLNVTAQVEKIMSTKQRIKDKNYYLVDESCHNGDTIKINSTLKFLFVNGEAVQCMPSSLFLKSSMAMCLNYKIVPLKTANCVRLIAR